MHHLASPPTRHAAAPARGLLGRLAGPVAGLLAGPLGGPCASTFPDTIPDPERDRGDVPGWVLVTLMTAGLVLALWAVAGPALTNLFQDAISRVGSFGG